MSEKELGEKLRPFLPQGVEFDVARLIIHFKVYFRITRPRDSVYGDYTSPVMNQPHKITVNGNQNKYAFFITTLHEFAHLLTWEHYKNKVKPHGSEWKSEFKKLVDPYLKHTIFPAELQTALKNYMLNPAASSCSDEDLMKALRLFDRKNKPILDDLAHNTRFEINNQVFIKGEKKRTRYLCRDVKTGQSFYIHGIAEVNPVMAE